MAVETRVSDLKSRGLALVRSLDEWAFDGEDSKVNLHQLGAELESIRGQLADASRDAKFPTFMKSPVQTSAETERELVQRRRDLLVLVLGLAPSDIEILECLGAKEDKESAFLYAYSRGSVSETSYFLKTEFFHLVEQIADDDPVLAEAKRVEGILGTARHKFSICQAEAYENLN